GLVEVPQRELERAEERDDVLKRHEAQVGDADELPFHLALTPGHDRVVVIAEEADEIAGVDASRGTECGHRRRGVALVGEELKVYSLKAAPRRAGKSSVHPAPETLSTRKSLPESRTTAAMSFIGFRTPVDVSLWVMRTAFAASLPFSLASSSRTRSGSTARPYGTSTRRASTPYALQIAAKRSPNAPP